jgi:uncharacterized protein YndB with AHSA1/START domain
MDSRFDYVTYIRATPGDLWRALTDPVMTRQYWYGVVHDTNWKQGAPWRLLRGDQVIDSGEIVEIEPGRRLELKWRNEFQPEIKAEGYGRCAIDVEAEDGAVKLAVSHTMPVARSKMIEAVSLGWPRLLSSLKSLIETGRPLVTASDPDRARRDTEEIGHRSN